MNEIVGLWFLVITLGGIDFGSLTYFDTKAECEQLETAMTDAGLPAKCIVLPLGKKA